MFTSRRGYPPFQESAGTSISETAIRDLHGSALNAKIKPRDYRRILLGALLFGEDKPMAVVFRRGTLLLRHE